MPEIKIATLGELWIGMPEMKVQADPLIGKLGKLLAPVAALRLIGSSEALFEQAEQLKGVALRNHDFPIRQLWTKEDRSETERHLDRFGGQLNFCYKRARAAEKILAAGGWKFNPETRKVTRISAGAPDLLRECVRAIYTEKYRKEYETLSLLKKFSVREKIAKQLSPFFEEKLSPKSGALIDATIRKVKNRPL